MLPLLLAAASLLVATPAHAVDLIFRVDMSYQEQLGDFDPASDTVDLAGDFNGWGTAPLTPLADPDGDSIHEVVVGGFSPGQLIEFKFRLDGQWDGREEFAGGGPNRQYTVQPSGNEILVWYSDREPHVVDPTEISWWNDSVFYQVFVRSFQDSDGDGIGDLQGLISRLDHLNDGNPATGDDLGVTALWLMPIHDSPSYHGYDAVDYRSVHPDYGTLADLSQLVQECHARGIRVILDFVMNHNSTQHPWFQAAAGGDPQYRGWYRWSPTDPGETGPWGQPVWHWHPTGWYYGLFWSGMPDLDYSNPAVEAEMFDTASFWLDTMGIDGFRLDAVLFIDEDGAQHQHTPGTLQFWQDFGAHVRSVAPDAMTVGEAWTSTSAVLPYVQEDRLDLCFEFDLGYAMVGGVNGGDAGWLSSKALEAYERYPHLQYGTFLTNHDQDRSFTVLGEDLAKAKLAAALYLTQPGVPFVYYGEEIGMTGAGAHENIRTPMQWTAGPQAGFSTGTPWYPVDPNHTQYNVADQLGDPGSLLEWYRQLIGLRMELPALRRGEYFALSVPDSRLFAFVREYAGQRLLFVANLGEDAMDGAWVEGSAASLPAGSYQLEERLAGGPAWSTPVTAGHRLEGLDLGPREARLYEFAQGTPAPGAIPRPRARLLAPAPNPFNPATTLSFELGRATRVRLVVHDSAGRELRVLLDGPRGAGRHSLRWDGMDRDGRALASGVYFVRLQAGGEEDLRRVVLLK